MSTSMIEPGGSRAVKVKVTRDALIVDLADGRTVVAPVAWYPRLLRGTPQERNHWRLVGGGEGIHWPNLDEDVSIDALLAGKPSGESQRSFKRWLVSREAKRPNKRQAILPLGRTLPGQSAEGPLLRLLQPEETARRRRARGLVSQDARQERAAAHLVAERPSGSTRSLSKRRRGASARYHAQPTRTRGLAARRGRPSPPIRGDLDHEGGRDDIRRTRARSGRRRASGREVFWCGPLQVRRDVQGRGARDHGNGSPEGPRRVLASHKPRKAILRAGSLAVTRSRTSFHGHYEVVSIGGNGPEEGIRGGG
ncbi:MAG: DUF2442 domain-containing protein [Candidatus Rokubacteria bacterium]|nr:DUF2442 domain-containing protein [Candidatus Rokubacteria bacterium]